MDDSAWLQARLLLPFSALKPTQFRRVFGYNSPELLVQDYLAIAAQFAHHMRMDAHHTLEQLFPTGILAFYAAPRHRVPIANRSKLAFLDIYAIVKRYVRGNTSVVQIEIDYGLGATQVAVALHNALNVLAVLEAARYVYPLLPHATLEACPEFLREAILTIQADSSVSELNVDDTVLVLLADGTDVVAQSGRGLPLPAAKLKNKVSTCRFECVTTLGSPAHAVAMSPMIGGGGNETKALAAAIHDYVRGMIDLYRLPYAFNDVVVLIFGDRGTRSSTLERVMVDGGAESAKIFIVNPSFLGKRKQFEPPEDVYSHGQSSLRVSVEKFFANKQSSIFEHQRQVFVRGLERADALLHVWVADVNRCRGAPPLDEPLLHAWQRATLERLIRERAAPARPFPPPARAAAIAASPQPPHLTVALRRLPAAWLAQLRAMAAQNAIGPLPPQTRLDNDLVPKLQQSILAAQRRRMAILPDAYYLLSKRVQTHLWRLSFITMLTFGVSDRRVVFRARVRPSMARAFTHRLHIEIETRGDGTLYVIVVATCSCARGKLGICSHIVAFFVIMTNPETTFAWVSAEATEMTVSPETPLVAAQQLLKKAHQEPAIVPVCVRGIKVDARPQNEFACPAHTCTHGANKTRCVYRSLGPLAAHLWRDHGDYCKARDLNSKQDVREALEGDEDQAVAELVDFIVSDDDEEADGDEDAAAADASLEDDDDGDGGDGDDDDDDDDDEEVSISLSDDDQDAEDADTVSVTQMHAARRAHVRAVARYNLRATTAPAHVNRNSFANDSDLDAYIYESDEEQ